MPRRACFLPWCVASVAEDLLDIKIVARGLFMSGASRFVGYHHCSSFSLTFPYISCYILYQICATYIYIYGGGGSGDAR